ncbi:MAG TPA: aldo/keto reductase [Gaiellaceae bacterium]|nr:aldo/keto reductase [Gaiellaceae bacterium]
MRTRKLGQLEVPVVGLGCNNFGGRVDEAGTRAVVDAALDAGVTFFDTADIYGRQGGSEELLGRALRARRDRVVLATKFGKPMGDGVERRGTREYVRAALEASLRRLQTDRVDLYQHHEEDPDTPLEETIGALEELVGEGKILAYGTSNYAVESLERAKALAGPAYVSEQSEYSWLERDAERELLPACERLGLGFIPYFPLASGLLTGKVRRGRPPEPGTRLHGREISDDELDRVERLADWAEAHGVSLLDVAVGGLAAVAPVVSVIAGATKPEQVRANAAAGEWVPSPEELDELLNGAWHR